MSSSVLSIDKMASSSESDDETSLAVNLDDKDARPAVKTYQFPSRKRFLSFWYYYSISACVTLTRMRTRTKLAAIFFTILCLRRRQLPNQLPEREGRQEIRALFSLPGESELSVVLIDKTTSLSSISAYPSNLDNNAAAAKLSQAESTTGTAVSLNEKEIILGAKVNSTVTFRSSPEIHHSAESSVSLALPSRPSLSLPSCLSLNTAKWLNATRLGNLRMSVPADKDPNHPEYAILQDFVQTMALEFLGTTEKDALTTQQGANSSTHSHQHRVYGKVRLSH